MTEFLAASCATRRAGREAAIRCRHRDGSLTKTALQKTAEPRILLEQAVYQVILLIKGNKLKGRLAVDGYHHRLITT